MDTQEDNYPIQQAQERLLARRASQKAMMHHGRWIMFADSQPESLATIIARCSRKARSSVGLSEPPPDDIVMPVNNAARFLAASGVSPRHAGCTLDSYMGNPTVIDILRTAIKKGESVLLTGKTGCGKTHLAAAMLAECLPKHRNAIFVTVPELLMKIRSVFSPHATMTEEEVVEHYTSCGLLMLDDLGAEKTSEYSITTLYLILDRRNRQCSQTVVTSNLSLPEIADTLGARIASRLADMKIITIASMGDYRKKRT